MLSFDKKLKLECKNKILIHTGIIWGQLDGFVFLNLFFLLKNTLLFYFDSLL